jgi:hypothetical protein
MTPYIEGRSRIMALRRFAALAIVAAVSVSTGGAGAAGVSPGASTAGLSTARLSAARLSAARLSTGEVRTGEVSTRAVVQVQAEGAAPGSDLDAFMRQVLAKRDDNWKKLQQYVLDEREAIDLRGPGRTPIWGERRDYTWYIRDGFFVRSPVRVNGVTVGEADRRRYEADFLRREQQRERRRNRGQPENDVRPSDTTGDLGALLGQTREPQFISSAYFLRFRFEEGKYALVGRETLEGPGRNGLDVLRIEYYPSRLFTGTDRRRNRDASPPDAEEKARQKAYDAEVQRLLNKTSLITLWVEPNAHQIVKYTFDNVTFDFLPAQWLVHIDDLHATMTMDRPFPDVWLPKTLEFQAALTLAVGQFDVHYGLEYHDYRRPDVTTKVAVPKGR